MSGGIIALIVVGVLMLLIGPMAVMAIYGVRKYIANSKVVEARVTLAEIARDESTAYEKESMSSGLLQAGQQTAVQRHLCPSASRSVPASAASIRGMKYMSAPSDWDADEATNGGFYCLKFSMDQPQYYMYSYSATGSTFLAKANGDLNGDGALSTFSLGGSVDGTGTLSIDPTVREVDPME
jgi:type IV pilus assembly protein PilA